ncbi:MAG: hypothetical protein WCP39_05460, partial [Chlamydiota bacterium]
NLYCFVLNDPLIRIDLYGLESAFWNQCFDYSKQASFGAMHGLGKGAMGIASGVSDTGFWITSPARYAYHSLRGEGSVMNDFHSHQQSLHQLQSFGENALQRAFPADRNSLMFQSFQTVAETSTMAATFTALARPLVQKGISWAGANMMRVPLEETRIQNLELNRFHQAANNLSEVGQNNIRVLRGWAKSKGWEKLPNSAGAPETWGNFNQSKNKFDWRLKIKPEASFREGLQVDSNIPRASARFEEGLYINPFTGETGGTGIGGHIPLERLYYK